MSYWTRPVPEPPERDTWGFVDALRRPDGQKPRWAEGKPIPPGALNLRKGLFVQAGFPDPDGRLDTSLEDLTRFLERSDLLRGDGVPLSTRTSPHLNEEQFEITITQSGICLGAGTTEGIRRGLYALRNEILSGPGPFLLEGKIKSSPWLKNRIGRCFFGPIKRPPFYRDELLDDIDYYPDAYLSRLASEGINGIWLTVDFRDLCQTTMTELDPLAEQRLAKLRCTVAKCLRYGIRTWAFCIEPRAFEAGDPLLQRFPELGGAPHGGQGGRHFCPSSDRARQYLSESTHWLFSQVPGLGGLLNISQGERATTCLSPLGGSTDHPVDCPRCRTIPKWQILEQSLGAMRAGMHAADPDAELISWLYMPTPKPRPPWVFEIADHTPKGVILQYNFESNYQKTQLGSPRIGGDYWLSVPGPSEDFAEMARRALRAGTEISAKIQVGCSHEIANIPFVPVPGLLYQKYRAMREAGCTHVMQSWYFGNYPGLMNRAAGLLAREAFAGTESDFLFRLARPDWGSASPQVVRAWQCFAEGYSHYPLSNMFQYYGPVQDGVVWPLHLKPAMRPLAPTWIAGFPPSGDVVGECLAGFTLKEAWALCETMERHWREGMAILESVRSQFADDPDRRQDIGLAETIGIQITAGRNILRFYFLRHQLISGQTEGWEEELEEMRGIVASEISQSQRLTELCLEDSRLGFHSEAEIHKYYPELLRWRMAQLQELLDTEFREIEKLLRSGQPFPSEVPGTTSYRCGQGWWDGKRFRWRLDWEPGNLVLRAECQQNPGCWSVLNVYFLDKAGIRHPVHFMVDAENLVGFPNPPEAIIRNEKIGEDLWRLEIRIPEDSWCSDNAGPPAQVCFHLFDPTLDGKRLEETWPPAPTPLRTRLDLYHFNPQYLAYFE